MVESKHVWLFPTWLLPGVGERVLRLCCLKLHSTRVSRTSPLNQLCHFGSLDGNGYSPKHFEARRGFLLHALLIIRHPTIHFFPVSLISLEDWAKGMLKFPVTQNLHRLSHFKPRAVHPTENSKHCFHTSLLTKGKVVCWL